jgi:hypothetical protein
MTVNETILTPLIVLSFTKEGIDNAIGSGNFRSIVGGADVMTFPGSHSNNFTKLTHTYGVEKAGSYDITIEMIDPVAEFETRFLQLDLANVIASDLITQGGSISSEVERTTLELEASHIKSSGAIQAVEQAAEKKKVWITYGLGNDLDNWAGPFELSLNNAQLKIDNKNIKKLILKFTPHADFITSPPPITGESRDVDYAGLRNTAVGTVGPFQIGDQHPLDPERNPVGTKEYGGTGDVGNWFPFVDEVSCQAEGLNTFFTHFDVHATLMACLRTMVRKATNCNNVVALFPNINTYGIKTIATGLERLRGTGLTIEDDKHEWLVDAADKVFALFGADLCIETIPDIAYRLISPLAPRGPRGRLLETNYAQFLEYFETWDDTLRIWEESKWYIQMQSITESSEGHRRGIRNKMKFIIEALMQNYPTLDTVFVSESRPEIVERFRGSPGVDHDGPIIFFGDTALIQNVVYNTGEASTRYLHPADKQLVGKGVGYGGLGAGPPTALPEFRMNVKDPNILSLEVHKDDVYLQALLAGFRANAGSKVGKVAAKLAEANQPGADTNAGVQNIMQVLTDNRAWSDQATAELLLAVQKDLTKTESKTTYQMNTSYNNNTFGVLAAAYDKMYKLSTEVSITTLPMFHLSDPSVFGMECVVIASTPEAVVPGAPGSSPNLSNSFFSGAYKITGFQHEITSTGIAKSKFALQKVQQQATPGEDI